MARRRATSDPAPVCFQPEVPLAVRVKTRMLANKVATAGVLLILTVIAVGASQAFVIARIRRTPDTFPKSPGAQQATSQIGTGVAGPPLWWEKLADRSDSAQKAVAKLVDPGATDCGQFGPGTNLSELARAIECVRNTTRNGKSS